MERDVERILIPGPRIAQRVGELANSIATDIRNEGDGELSILAILTGSLIFLSDFIRQLPLRLRVQLLTASSYRGRATTPGRLIIDDSALDTLRGHRVLILDDILDSGATLAAVRERVLAHGPRSVRTCVLLRKEKPKRVFRADYVGFDVPDTFIVGYGLDHDGLYRNLPDLVTLKPEALQ